LPNIRRSLSETKSTTAESISTDENDVDEKTLKSRSNRHREKTLPFARKGMFIKSMFS